MDSTAMPSRSARIRVRWGGALLAVTPVAGCSAPVQDGSNLRTVVDEQVPVAGITDATEREVYFGDLHLHTGFSLGAARASYANTIGASDLVGTWTDPDFDPAQRAVYYARVIEIPAPRWATYLSVASGIPLAKGTKAWLQERAWTSPVSYTP